MSACGSSDVLDMAWSPLLPPSAEALLVDERFPCLLTPTPCSLRDYVEDWCEDHLSGMVRLHWAHRRIGGTTEFCLWLLFASAADRVAFGLRWIGE